MALVAATFPLIWIGGLVTTYGAGMAVPDWPNTYGYNLLLYPLDTWIDGPWKLFVEHGHRLYATLVGLITIAFLISAWRCQRRVVVRVLGVVALAAVLFQGALGGMRVIENQVQLAKIHGCFGPAFFALTVALAAVTSRRWQQPTIESRAGLPGTLRLALLTTLLAYCQLVLGSQLRHLPAGAQPDDFRIALVFHVITAAVLAVHVVLLAAHVVRTERRERWLMRPAVGLVCLILIEISLGTATWVAKYGWPGWLDDFAFAASNVVKADSRPQAWIATAHVAVGSLILATSALVTLRAARLVWRGSPASEQGALRLEVAR